MDSNEVEARIAEAARSFDAELHTQEYAETHSDEQQLARLLSFLSPVDGQAILDLGTGNGYVAMAIANAHPGCRVVGVDVAAEAIDRDLELARTRCLSNASFQSYDGMRLPFADGYFDAAVSRYAFHHFPRPEMILQELGRTLGSGGRLVLSDAIREDSDNTDFVNRFQELKRDGHVCMYRGAELLDLVRRHGFEEMESFESSITFVRGRSAECDRLLSSTPERVLQAYSLLLGESEMTLRFRILNALFVNKVRLGGAIQPDPV